MHILNSLRSIISFSAIIVSGGGGGLNSKNSAEILIEDGKTFKSCSLPNLPDSRYHHTQSGATLCGGYGDDDDDRMHSTCLTFSNSKWKESHTLLEPWIYQSSWSSPNGILLMGNTASKENYGRGTELLNDDGTSSKQFDLKHTTS